MKISKYNPEHADDIFAAIRKDTDWDMFSNDVAIDSYRKSLKTVLPMSVITAMNSVVILGQYLMTVLQFM